MNKTAVFVNNSELNWSGHLFAYYVVKKIAELESIKKKELKGEAISKIITKANNHVLELRKNIESIENIQTIADGVRTTCQTKLSELISFSNALRRTMNERIAEIFEDMKKVEI